MYLFQRYVKDCGVTSVTAIYIPLCIYFNQQPTRHILKALSIYIPLCIYFNLMCAIIKLSNKKFTFHYVSISTHLVLFIFLCVLNLHSTMYLFQPAMLLSCPGISSQFTFHYVSISTCFIESFFRLCTLFTFHYVSISTYSRNS